MNAFLTRPRIADLVFQVYGRPLHPELFDVLAVRQIEHENARISVRLTRTGHMVIWQNDELLLTEIADADQQLETRGRLVHFKMRGEHSYTLPSRHGITYQTSFQVETMTPEIFRHVHDEILADGRKGGLLHHFGPNHRFAVSPVSFIDVQAKSGCIFVLAFHTFPDENTVVKSQSLIERR